MHLAPFLLVSAVVILTPGVDMALITKNALVHGPVAARATALGVNAGILFWTLAAAVGLAAVVAASAVAFAAIKLAGAVYLIVLGLQALRGRRHAEAGRERRAPLGRGAALRQGLASNLLNPKIAIFFTSLLPQFVDAQHATAADLLLLGTLFNSMGFLWLVSYATLAARGRAVLTRPRVQRAVERLSGAVLVALGVRIALDR